jgi:hypothetical protein
MKLPCLLLTLSYISHVFYLLIRSRNHLLTNARMLSCKSKDACADAVRLHVVTIRFLCVKLSTPCIVTLNGAFKFGNESFKTVFVLYCRPEFDYKRKHNKNVRKYFMAPYLIFTL